MRRQNQGFVKTTRFVPCPKRGCNQNVQIGIVMCAHGHWIKWEDETPIYVPTAPENFDSIIGRIHFQREPEVSSHEKPDPKSSVKTRFYPGQEVRLKAIDDDWFILMDGSFVLRKHVILWRSRDQKPEPAKQVAAQETATVIRDGGATVWKEPGFATRVRLIEKNKSVVVYERKGPAVRIHPSEQEWLNVAVLKFEKEEKPKKK